ncbi:MAG: hypothetical protein J1E62_10640 [Lachnospiraceae bacterium]|nr:hypothetical protein [Lachnospiraceae bacterium]
MGEIYSLGQQQKLIVYDYGKRIFMRTFQGGMAGRSTILADDYVGEFSETVYNGTVYYGYVNREGNYVVRNMGQRHSQVELPAGCMSGFCHGKLVAWQNKLILFVITNKKDIEEYCIQGYSVLENKDYPSYLLPVTFKTLPEIDVLSLQNVLIISVCYEERGMNAPAGGGSRGAVQCFCWEEEGEASQLRSEEVWREFMAKEMEEYAMTSARQQEEYRQLQESSNTQSEQLKRQIQERDAILESVKKQYEELMSTAIQYRDEAKRWRDRWLGSKRR